ncbi:cytochrome b5 family heme/steroid binding domain-containing protein [Besnoitia besnoiti]|uniref:Cytochrome b5 family heme/steroid binding domain-containing protein n=1 Tax=Besnoitia besnoiti TaxID=94643 RepID=A0A2A9M5D3_BESBE|nr:cytochrome b5 family heme/steroid binding domain-containing protein [Besnoitia besnoiti]PFH31116.1 cytochrome b5 family heme/steroid binding domain-containing protein [Besnoitia besnoiti]
MATRETETGREPWRTRVVSAEEVRKHNSEKDFWCIIHGVVYDLTPVLDKHPGGVEVLMDYAGEDASDAFEDIGHSFSARRMTVGLEVGVLAGAEDNAPGALSKTAKAATSAAREKADCSTCAGGLLSGRTAAGALIVLAAAATVFYILGIS